MSDASNEHRRPHPPPMAAPYLEFDLTTEIEQLHREAGWQSGQNAKTLVKYEDLRIVLTALKAQSRIPGHQTEGRISIHTIVGHLKVRAQGRTFDLPAGRVLAKRPAPTTTAAMITIVRIPRRTSRRDVFT